MLKIQVRRIVQVSLTPDQWGLYAEADAPGAKAAADALNGAASRALSAPQATPDSVRLALGSHMRRLSQHGANDTEAHAALERVIEQALGPATPTLANGGAALGQAPLGQSIEDVLAEASALLSAAESSWYAYAGLCEVGPQRTRAFEIYENVRNARRVWA